MKERGRGATTGCGDGARRDEAPAAMCTVRSPPATESLEEWGTPATMRERFQILSLDGGGIRGIFSAALLAAIEEDLGTRVADHFDLIAGTSTGGIIAVALGLGMSPKEIVDFYIRFGPRVFRNPFGVRSLQHWIFRKYSSGSFQKALQETFGERLFGESTKRLVIPSFNLGEDDVYVFRTPHSNKLRRDYKVPAWKVALATAAAPTYFPVCRAVDRLRLLDGGVWANNPAMVALVEAFGTLGVSLERTWLLSIGTYDAVAGRPSYLDEGGRIVWAFNAHKVILRAGSIGVDNQARFLLGGERLLRIDPKVPDSDVVLDDASRAEHLITRARHHSRAFMPEIAAKFGQHNAGSYSPVYPREKGPPHD